VTWLSRQFSTRVIVLIPVAIAINIVIGYLTQTVLKLPIYLDSIGTILVGVLAGPIPGALTGALANLIWQYAPGIGGGTIGPFAITAAVIGLLAGVWGYLGVYRSRPASGSQLAIAAAIAAVLVIVVIIPIVNNQTYLDPNIGGFPDWAVPAAIVIAVITAIIVAGFIYTRRDLAGLWVALAGIVTGLIAAAVSAPISAYVFGGVTGSGTDAIVAALRQGGSDVLQASLGQGFFSDPIDKTITSFVVYIILVNLSRRFLARFPLGERLVREGPTPASAAPPA
jgi:energy-coupling factor transport system substrate-specific component